MTRAVLLDALGTLVELQPPGPRLQRVLGEAGFDVSRERAVAAFGAEIGYYVEHHLDGANRESLEDLRDRCALVLMEALALPGLDHATARRAMLAALEFSAYPDAAPALAALRARGLRLVVVSNWDCALPGWLEGCGLGELVDGVVSSAAAGVAKPDAAIFERALALARTSADRAVHVGDSFDKDVEGARAAGLRAILVQRAGEPPAGVEAVGSLAELPSLV